MAKHQRRLPGFDDKVISLYARGFSVCEIRGHLTELYGLEVSPDLISTITGEVMDEVIEWQNRPLEPMYPLVFFDARRVKIRDEVPSRTRRCTSRWACVPTAPRRSWASGSSRPRVPKFWVRVMTALKNRGVEDVLIAVVDGLKGFPQAIIAVFPQAQIQTSIVYLIRNTLDFVGWKESKLVAAELKSIDRATTEAEAVQALDAFAIAPGG